MRSAATAAPDDADVIIVGGGNAAMCAALSAREHVSRVVVLESAPRSLRGGNTRHTRNVRHIHDAGDGVLSGEYTEDELWSDLVGVSDADLDEETARMVIRHSASIPAFMETHGVRWQPALKGTLHLSRTNRFFLGGGKVMLNAYYASAADKGIEVLYDTPVVDIIIASGKAAGVVANVDGQDVVIPAKAVVVASGGFEANRDWLREYWGAAADRFVVRGSAFNVGGPLRALLDRGARSVGQPKGAHAISVDARAPDYDGGIVTRIDSVPVSIMVNQDGVRFADEGEDLWPRRYAGWGHLIAAQPGQIAYSIYDSKVRDRFIPGLYPAHEAQTLRDLARLAGLPWTTLERTIREYNAAVRDDRPFDLGVLDGRRTVGLAVDKTNWAQAIDTPPFYAYPLRPGITFTYLGLKVDRDARVQFDEGPVPNLFAAGEIMSGNVLTAGYLAGFGLTIGAVFGRIAGTEAGRLAASGR